MTVYAIPIQSGRYIIYSPGAQSAFVGNAATVVRLRALRAGMDDADDPALTKFFRNLGLLTAAGPGRSPNAVRLNMDLKEDDQSSRVTSHLTPAYAFTALERAFQSLAVVPNGSALVLRIRNAQPLSEHSWLSDLLEKTTSACRRTAAALTSELELTLPPTSEETEWAVLHVDRVVIRIAMVDVVGTGGVSQTAKTIIHPWMRTVAQLSGALVPYSFEISAPLHGANQLAATVRHLCAIGRPVSVQAELIAPSDLVEGAAAAAAEDWMAALRSVRVACHRVGCNLVVAGAALDSPTTLSGKAAREMTISAEGTLLDSNSVEHRARCHGCFAEHHCLGGDDTRPQGSVHCYVAKEATKDELLSRIAASKGVAWMANDSHQPVHADMG